MALEALKARVLGHFRTEPSLHRCPSPPGLLPQLINEPLHFPDRPGGRIRSLRLPQRLMPGRTHTRNAIEKGHRSGVAGIPRREPNAGMNISNRSRTPSTRGIPKAAIPIHQPQGRSLLSPTIDARQRTESVPRTIRRRSSILNRSCSSRVNKKPSKKRLVPLRIRRSHKEAMANVGGSGGRGFRNLGVPLTPMLGIRTSSIPGTSKDSKGILQQ